jgi:hypothetical protein
MSDALAGESQTQPKLILYDQGLDRLRRFFGCSVATEQRWLCDSIREGALIMEQLYLSKA